MGLPRFTSPKGGEDESSPHLYVANCGPAVGFSNEIIASVFGMYGEVEAVCAADESGTRVIVSYHDTSSSQAAMKALNRHPCSSLGGRTLHIQYAVQSLGKVLGFSSSSKCIHSTYSLDTQRYLYICNASGLSKSSFPSEHCLSAALSMAMH